MMTVFSANINNIKFKYFLIVIININIIMQCIKFNECNIFIFKNIYIEDKIKNG